MAATPSIVFHPVGAVRPPTEALTKNIQGGVNFKVQVGDAISPVFKDILLTLEARIRVALMAGGKIIGDAVKNEYEIKRLASFPNQLNTQIWKGHGRQLEDSGNLKQSMENYKVDLFGYGGKGIRLAVTWYLPTSEGTGMFPENRKNNNFVYLWVHELGNKVGMKTKLTFNEEMIPELKYRPWFVVPRPFFLSGLKKGGESAMLAVYGIMAQHMQQLQDANKTNWMDKMGKYGTPFSPFPSILPSLGMGLIFYVTPPMRELSYLGMISDIQGLLAGSFTETQILSFVRQMGWGQTGFTKKSMRRRIRRRIWS